MDDFRWPESVLLLPAADATVKLACFAAGDKPYSLDFLDPTGQQRTGDVCPTLEAVMGTGSSVLQCV